MKEFKGRWNQIIVSVWGTFRQYSISYHTATWFHEHVVVCTYWGTGWWVMSLFRSGILLNLWFYKSSHILCLFLWYSRHQLWILLCCKRNTFFLVQINFMGCCFNKTFTFGFMQKKKTDIADIIIDYFSINALKYGLFIIHFGFESGCGWSGSNFGLTNYFVEFRWDFRST